VKRKDLVLRNLIRNLLTFGVSRKTHFSDQEEIETIAEVVAHRGYKMRDLVSMVATSDIFKSR